MAAPRPAGGRRRSTSSTRRIPLLCPAKRAKHIVTIHDLFFLKHPDMTEAEIRRDYVPLVRDHVRAPTASSASPSTPPPRRACCSTCPRRRSRSSPTASTPPTAMPVAAEAVDAVLARHRLPRGAHALRRQRGEAEEPGQPGHGLHGPGRAPARASPPLRPRRARARDWAQGGAVMGPQIRAMGYLETREIRALMAASAALVLPSLEEGFGLPVVEAMAAGLPVVCSRGSALEEVAGDAATLVNPLDTRSIADGIERMLDDPARAEKQRAKGLERSRAVRLGHRRRADARVLPAGPRLAEPAQRRRSTGASCRDGPPAPAATCATCCASGRGAGTATAVRRTSTARAPADPVLDHPRDRRRARWARARSRGLVWQERALPRGRARGRRGRLLLARLHLPAAPATSRA